MTKCNECQTQITKPINGENICGNCFSDAQENESWDMADEVTA